MISIVIPTLNEATYLPKLLLSIEKQTYTDYEIIVADANSSDGTQEIAKKFGCKLVKGGMPAVGRNAGAAAAKGKYLLFLDADVLLPEDCLEKFLAEFDKKYYQITTTTIYPLSSMNLDHLFYFFTNLLHTSTKKFYPYIPGFCILTTNRLHRRLGGFDEKIVLYEDNDYVYRAIKFGKYGICTTTNIWVSVRRLEKEGRLNLVHKYNLANIYRIFNKKIYDDVVEYEFGKFENAKDLSKLEEKLEHLLGTFDRWKDDYKRFVEKIREQQDKEK
ncbi:MAG: glycosyltransferase [bacterium]